MNQGRKGKWSWNFEWDILIIATAGADWNWDLCFCFVKNNDIKDHKDLCDFFDGIELNFGAKFSH